MEMNTELIAKAKKAKTPEELMALAKEKLVLAEKKLMQAAAKHTIHKNAASRKVSRHHQMERMRQFAHFL